MEVLLDPGAFDTSAVDIDTPGNYVVYVPLSVTGGHHRFHSHGRQCRRPAI